jgi:membrane protease YdiL (CAAX protease family)
MNYDVNFTFGILRKYLFYIITSGLSHPNDRMHYITDTSPYTKAWICFIFPYPLKAGRDLDLNSRLKKEFDRLSGLFMSGYRETVVIVIAVLCFTLHHYQQMEPYRVGALLYFLLIPVLAIILILRRNPLDFGLRFGNFRVWGPYTLLTLVIFVPVLFAFSGNTSLHQYYTRPDLDLLVYSGTTVVFLFSWEFIFRGFLLFGLKDRLGMLSIIVQMVPFVILHFGKPEIEVVSTIFTGLWFGYICYRGNSFWPAFIIHLVINISFMVFVNIL